MSERRQPERTRRLVLHDTTDAVSQCRDFTRRALTEWQWLPGAGSGSGGAYETADDALLLVSEVVANACMHAGGPSSLLLRCTGDRLRIEVTDASPVAPTVRHPSDPARPGGHGLLIVERLAREWGSEPVDGGKCVWVELDAPPVLRQGDGTLSGWRDGFPHPA
ncbi:ATP-binding protein [Streptomyces sp. ISL-43]|uniref:ATP-binding protein n=1 Tax=Streptomyces sp. ISL-43 TaxID=2819183 RepID=UPI001BE71F06|nr:ATP-binding protein [Streptomyces sp. ISL-43]MBT2448653.1 ATP-binding protein [Streptomyces sp. ISL-43]